MHTQCTSACETFNLFRISNCQIFTFKTCASQNREIPSEGYLLCHIPTVQIRRCCLRWPLDFNGSCAWNHCVGTSGSRPPEKGGQIFTAIFERPFLDISRKNF